jgi:hypothetical protein
MEDQVREAHQDGCAKTICAGTIVDQRRPLSDEDRRRWRHDLAAALERASSGGQTANS